jgi:YD repeat-containing protein
VQTKRSYSPQRGWLNDVGTYSPSAGSTPDLLSVTYTRDAAGRITDMVSASLGGNSGADWHYDYDKLDRLTRAKDDTAGGVTLDYAYDDAGNLTRNTAYGSGSGGDIVYGAVVGSRTLPHAVKRIGPDAATNFDYDANGNLKRDGASTAATTRKLDWDGENRPLQVKQGTTTANTTTTDYLYGSPVGTNRYAYAANDPVNKSDPSGHQIAETEMPDPEPEPNQGELAGQPTGFSPAGAIAGAIIGGEIGYYAGGAIAGARIIGTAVVTLGTSLGFDVPTSPAQVAAGAQAGGIAGAVIGGLIGGYFGGASQNEQTDEPTDEPEPETSLPSGIGVGPYAGGSVPIGPGPPTREQQKKINELGRTHGCHNCGTKDPKTKSGNFIADHQPPSSLKQPNQNQDGYPHCKSCSDTQGGLIRGFMYGRGQNGY